jgi:hypothetical protein
MSIKRSQPHRTAGRVPNWKGRPYRDIQMKIGEGLRAHYEPPKELSHQLLTLLIQMNERWEDK